MATNLPSYIFIEYLEQLLKFLLNFTLLKYVKSQRSYGFLITKELIYGFQILDLKDHFSASLKCIWNEILDNFIVLLESALKDKINAVYRLLITFLDPKLWRSEILKIEWENGK